VHRAVNVSKGEYRCPTRRIHPRRPLLGGCERARPEAALEFYGGLFGWEFEDVLPPSPEGNYFIARGKAASSSIFDTSGELRSGDVAAIRSIPQGAPPTVMWNTYFWVDSADEAAAKVRDAGGGVVAEPFDFLNACRMAVFTDPEGAAFSV
jgi:uncharacterized protein